MDRLGIINKLKKANTPNWNAAEVEDALLSAIEFLEDDSLSSSAVVMPKIAEELVPGCVVMMKASSGMRGYGNPQCVSSVCEFLGEISLYGHNQCYKIYDIKEIIEYPKT